MTVRCSEDDCLHCISVAVSAVYKPEQHSDAFNHRHFCFYPLAFLINKLTFTGIEDGEELNTGKEIFDFLNDG